MVETPDRSRIESGDRGNPAPQWELFVRQEAGEPMCHVGSVAAASGPEAHDHATRLFGREVVDVWCCPADVVERYSTRGLAADCADRDRPDANSETTTSTEQHGTPEVSDS